MYHPQVVSQRLARAKEAIGFTPRRHSIESARQAVDYFDDLLNDDGELDRAKRPTGLLPDEVQWINNERILCKNDFLYFCTRYAHIRHYESRVCLFEPNIAQKLNLTLWAQQELQGHPIEIIQLKARRLGMSTVVDLTLCHRTFFRQNINAVIASSDPKKSEEMSKIIELCYDRLPWWLAPERTKYRAGTLMEFGKLNSGISIQHGSQFSGISRGASPSIYHCSELPDYEDAGESVDASLLNAIIPDRNTFGVLESTAKGYDWWYRTWKLSVEGWPRGRSRLRPIFLPWYVGTDIKPTPDWVNAYITDRGIDLNAWKFSVAALRHKDRAERYVHKESLILEKLLGKDWTLPLHQLYWWEFHRDEAVQKRELHKFLEENPGDEMEAFQSQSDSVFSVEDLERFNAQSREPKAVYSVIGTGIDPKLHPDPREIDRGKVPKIGFKVSYAWNPMHPGQYQFIPLFWRGYENEGDGWQRKLLVWEFPQPGEEYTLGIDTCYGMGQDRSVIQVLRKGSAYRYDEQVAEFADPWIAAEDLWPFCMAIGTWYSQGSSRNSRFHKQCRQVIEVNATGRNTQLELKKRGWRNFHPWLHIDRKVLNPAHYVLEGWVTNQKSRHEMMGNSLRAARNGSLLINSRYLVEEMKHLQKDDDTAYVNTIYGQHDDRWMGLGFAYYSSHQLLVETDEKQMRPSPEQYLETLPTYATQQALAQPKFPVTYNQWMTKMSGLPGPRRY